MPHRHRHHHHSVPTKYAPPSATFLPHIIARSCDEFISPRVVNYRSKDMATIYKFPTPNSTQQIVIAVISLGGGLYGTVDANGFLTGGDVQAYWTIQGITNQPRVKIISVNGATNRPSSNDSATIENTIDVEMVGSCCPGANVTILFYIAPNSVTGFYNVLSAAINNTVAINGVNYKPSVVSCSWGAPEALFSISDLNRFNTLFQQATQNNINICCASGDLGSSNGLSGLNTDFPASSPYVLACGGTTLSCPTLNYNDPQTTEIAWSGSGGGISRIFSSPVYQTNLRKPNRCVPDIALHADPTIGVSFLINNQTRIVGGTSIVAPAMAAFLGASGITGFFNPRLYACNSTAFNDITSGNNGAYIATAGYDNTTGLGSINGLDIQTQLASWVRVTSISIPPSVSYVAVGQTLQLSSTVLPANATNKNVVWTSSNSLLASVNSTGLVTGMFVSSTPIVITATTVDGWFQTNRMITVTAAPPVSVTGISLAPITATINVTQTLTLVPTVYPANATNKTVSWLSSNTSIATVSQNGQVRGNSNGVVTITATTVDGLRSASSTVTVVTPVSSVTLRVSSLKVGSTVTLAPTILPSTASNTSLVWASTNPSVASVASGVVTGVSVGTTTITATTNGISASWPITIVA